MDKIDYKKLNRALYMPKTEPSIITVPTMNFIMVHGKGNPNTSGGEYPSAVELLYALTYTIKMGLKFGTISTGPDVFPDYVAPPLEGLWWLNNERDFDFTQKEKFCWISMIRQPDFITKEIFDQAACEVKKKKPELDVSKASFEVFGECLCVQCMHIGPFDNEPTTLAAIDRYIESNGLVGDYNAVLPDGHIRRHHEIYLADPRKSDLAKMKTVLRIPVKYR